MYEYLLPIGSVVKLRDVEKPLMIFGILQNNSRVSDKTFDYIGVPYPEGHFDIRLHLGFNHNDIDNILFTGLHNSDREAFLATLEITALIKNKNAD